MKQIAKQILKTQKSDNMIWPQESYITNPQYNKNPVSPIFPLDLILSSFRFPETAMEIDVMDMFPKASRVQQI